MKRFNLYLKGIIIVLSIITSTANAQSLSCGFDIGAGSSYIIEHYESGSLTDYSTSLATAVNVKYTPKDAYFGMKLSVLYVSSTFSMENPFYGIEYGEVSSVTPSLLLEHLNDTKKLNLGYNFGLGLTREDYQTSQTQFYGNQIRNFSSISLSGILAYSASDRTSIRLIPMLLWTDPINTLRKYNWYNGREDLSALLQLGFWYRLN